MPLKRPVIPIGYPAGGVGGTIPNGNGDSRPTADGGLGVSTGGASVQIGETVSLDEATARVEQMGDDVVNAAQGLYNLATGQSSPPPPPPQSDRKKTK